MTDDIQDLPSNSHQSRTEIESVELDIVESEVKQPREKIVSGTVVRKKQSFGSKFKELFFGSDAKSVGMYVVEEVIVPGIRDMIFGAGTQGLERAIYGDDIPISRNQPIRRTGYTSYNKVAQPISSRGRNMHLRALEEKQSVEDLIFPSQQEARGVLEELHMIIQQYGEVSIQELNEMCGITSNNYQDRKWGWNDLSRARLERVAGGGYRLRLPRAIPVD